MSTLLLVGQVFVNLEECLSFPLSLSACWELVMGMEGGWTLCGIIKKGKKESFGSKGKVNFPLVRSILWGVVSM